MGRDVKRSIKLERIELNYWLKRSSDIEEKKVIR